MASERWAGLLKAALVALAALAGCVSPALHQDISRVRALAAAPALPPLPSGRIETDVAQEVRARLQRPLDADAAVRIALLNNRELRARLRELGVDRGRLMQAGLLDNPTLEAELMPERNSRLELRAEYDLMSFVLTPMRKRAARRELEAARLTVAGEVVALGYQVRTALYALQAAEQRYRAALAALDALAAARDAASALYDAGNTPALSVATQISAYERGRITLAKLELERVERREQVQRLLGLHGEATQWRVAPELAPPPQEAGAPDALERRALKANLELAAIKQRLEAIARRTGIARLEGWLPHLEVDVHTLVGQPGSAASDDVRWGGGVALEVPLFDRQQGSRRAQEAGFDAWLERYQGLAIDIRSAAREAGARLRSAHRRARQYATVIVPAQDTVMKQTQLQYNAMQLGVFQLLSARRAQLDVALEYAETLREYWSAAAELDALLAGQLVRSSATGRAVAMDATATEQEGH